MTRTRITPKWLSFLLPLSLSLAVLTTVGCGGDDPVPPPPPPVVKSSEAGIASLTLTGRKLEPSWTSAVKNYGAEWVYTDVPSVTLTVTLKDTKGKLFINNTAATSGQGRAITLIDGTNTINVATLAEDGHTADYTTITVNRVPLNASIWVVDGFGGAPLEGTVVRLCDENDRLLVGNVPLPKAKNGTALFALEPNKKYNIYAKGVDSAEACFRNFDLAFEDTAILIAQPSFTTGIPREAPIITNISFSTANSDAGGTGGWLTMPNESTFVGPMANVFAVRVTAISKNPIATRYTYGSELPPVIVNVDAPASTTFNNNAAAGTIATAVASQMAIPVKYNGEDYYQSMYRAALPRMQSNLANQNHYLSVVVYDLASNRTEQRVYLKINNSAPTGTDPNISALVPVWSLFQAQTFGFSQAFPKADPKDPDANAIDPVDHYYGGTVQVLFQFTHGSQAIRGYELECSKDRVNWKKVIHQNYATTTTAAALGVDRNPMLNAEDNFYYRVRVFNNNPAGAGYSRWSEVSTAVKPLPAFQATEAPTHERISRKIWPTFKIAPTDLRMHDGRAGTMFYTIYLKDTHSNYPLLAVPFSVTFGARTVNPGDAWGAGKPLVQYRRVTAYSGNGVFTGLWHDASYQDGTVTVGETVYPRMVPVAWIDDNGYLVIDTDNEMFQSDDMAYNVVSYLPDSGGMLMPGASYQWSIFGFNGAGIMGLNAGQPGRLNDTTSTNAACGYTAAVNPGTTTPLAYSYGSGSYYGFGSPQGFFTLTIHPDAE